MAISGSGNVQEVTKLKKMARLKQFSDLESAWIAAIDRGHFTSENNISILEVVAQQNDLPQTENLAWVLLSMTSDKQGIEAALEIARQVANHAPKSETLRTELAEIYRKAYSDLEELEFLLEITILRQAAALNSAVAQIDTLIALEKSGYAIDKTLPNPGKVVGLDKEKKAIKIIFDGEEKKYTVHKLNKIEALTGDDFRALQTFDPEKLKTLANEDPGELARLILEAHGKTLKFREIKPFITPIIKGTTWTQWWKEAKPKIKRSAIVELSDAAQPTFTLRDRPLSYSFRVRDQFVSAPTLEEKLLTVLEYIRERNANTETDETLITFFAEQLKKLGAASNDTVYQLATQAKLQQLHKHFPDIIPQTEFDFHEIFSDDVDLTNFFSSSHNEDVSITVLEFIREEKQDDWYDIFAAMMPGSPTSVCEWIANQLLPLELKESLTKAIETILHWPDRYPRAIVWLCKAITGDKLPDALANVDKSTLLTGLFTAATALKRKPPFDDVEQQKKALNQIRNVLIADKYALLREVLKTSNRDYANFIKDTYAFNPGFSDAVKTDIGTVLHDIRPDLFLKNIPAWLEEVVYTTEEAMARKNEELAQLVNVEIAHNAKTIGEAAERGDLSENAEFTAALEERDRLTERATRLQGELKKAKIIYPGFAANSDVVTIGTNVKALNLTTNEEKTFTFLGPWDANPDNGIYSYLAPVAQVFMGKKINETINHLTDTDTTDWKILEISPAI